MADPNFNLVNPSPYDLSTGVFDSASPTFADIDGDSDLDAFVGNKDGNTIFFQNTGTSNNPAFEAPVINPFGLINAGGSKPTFADIDGDGDYDAFLGDFYGNTLFFQNTGTSSSPIFAAPITNPFGLSDVGYNASPIFVDIDGDKDLDIFIGDTYGNINFLPNTGTGSSPIFGTAVSNPFGLVKDANSTSSQPAFVDVDGDGDLDAFVGTQLGNVVFYRNTGTINNPAFGGSVINPFGLSDVGYNSDPTFVDINNDNQLDAFVGNSQGQTLFYLNAPPGVLLFSTAGNDILNGTISFNDTVSYVSSTAAVAVSLAITKQQNTLGAGLDTLTKIENLIGSNFNDNLTGNSLSNILNGGTGDDKINGGIAADTLIGGLGSDVYTVDNVGDTIIENFNEGTDKVNSNITSTLPANVENLTLTGTLAIDGTGNDQANILNGNTANNRLVGFIGNDILNGSAGGDDLIGGLGDDVYFVDDAGDAVHEGLNEGIDKVNSSITYTLPDFVENLTLTGTSAINGTGNDLANVVIGNNANNQISGGNQVDLNAIDTLIGGLGDDTYSTHLGTEVIIEKPNEGIDTVLGFISGALPANVENQTLVNNDTTAIGNDLANVITGNTVFSNSLIGGGGNDTLVGGIGADILDGGSGVDILIGGLGNDFYIVDETLDSVTENLNEGIDTISSNLTFTLPANVENLTLTGALVISGTGNEMANIITGNSAINQLFGGNGNDVLNGKAGADGLTGGLGNDNYIVDNSGDIVTEGVNEGTDKINSSITRILPANVENLTLTGATATNGTGNGLANVLIGNSNSNQLNGAGGNDKLEGGAGINTLTGGAGKDIFQFVSASHVDTITDFVVVDDTVQLENAVFNALTTLGTLAVDQFRIGSSALDANDHIIYNNSTGALLYDADGSGAGAAQQVATMSAGLAMTNADILVI